MNPVRRSARGLAQVLILWALGGHALWASAQAWRDPTMAPFQGATGGTSQEPPAAEVPPMSVIVVDGRPHVIMGTRLYAPGQMLGQARIERITDTEIWLREGRVLRKVPRFSSGIERRTVEPSASPECEAEAARKSATIPASPEGVSCPDAQQ